MLYPDDRITHRVNVTSASPTNVISNKREHKNHASEKATKANLLQSHGGSLKFSTLYYLNITLIP
jgi:hypothetical protein